MPSTDDGIPLLGVGGGDPVLLRQRIAEARELPDRDERAVRLYFLGRGLLDCDDPTTATEAVVVLHEAMELGSAHAAFDLGQFLIDQAESPKELAMGMALVARAAAAHLPEAEVWVAAWRHAPTR